ncbi:hypothetical protein D3C72_2116670 [compost metagenome]
MFGEFQVAVVLVDLDRQKPVRRRPLAALGGRLVGVAVGADRLVRPGQTAAAAGDHLLDLLNRRHLLVDVHVLDVLPAVRPLLDALHRGPLQNCQPPRLGERSMSGDSPGMSSG